MSDELILVNLNDEELGHQEKIDAHSSASLHRAFSVFLYKIVDEKWVRMLLQKRAEGKYHSEVCGRMPAVPIQGTQRHFQKRYHGLYDGRAGDKDKKSGDDTLSFIFTDFLKPVQNMNMTMCLSSRWDTKVMPNPGEISEIGPGGVL